MINIKLIKINAIVFWRLEDVEEFFQKPEELIPCLAKFFGANLAAEKLLNLSVHEKYAI